MNNQEINISKRGISVRDIVIVAMLSALAFVLSLFKVFQMPNGGSITLYLTILYIALDNEKIKNCLFIGLVVAILQMFMGGFLANFLSGIFDYVIPVVAITCAGIFTKNLYLNIIIGAIIALASYVLSGMLFWETPFMASLIYNATFFIPSVILNAIVYTIIRKPISNALNQNNR